MLPFGDQDGACVDVVEARGDGVSDLSGAKVSATANENADGAYDYAVSYPSHSANHGRDVLEPSRVLAAA
jgi:hypothetical protein